jgi:outer membrane protein OmpA-like peptidoglycan-associated protein
MFVESVTDTRILIMKCQFWSLTALSATLLAGTAIAQTGGSDDWLTGGAWYLGAKVGGNWLADDTHVFSPNPFAPQFNGRASYDDGYIGAVQGGFAFGNGLRLEEEFSYRYNQVDHVSPYGSGRGSMRNYAIMTNALYDLPVDFPLKPYVGVGVGASDYAPYHIRGDAMPYPAYVGGPDAWGFAWQAIGGVSFDLTDDIALTAEYRYFEDVGDHPRGVSNDYESHSALVGIRYSFGAPVVHEVAATYTPPPPPAPAPVARNYLVFFNFDKSDLTDDARRVVDEAAANAKTASVTRLDVTGYTDTVGSEAYNMRLSRRRAESVSAELQAQGIAASDIAIFAKGKHDLLVPTADGVREPQNRRVQIVFGGAPSS